MYFNVGREGTYTFNEQTYALGAKFLVDVPMDMFSALTFPDFSGLATTTGVKYVVMFALIGVWSRCSARRPLIRSIHIGERPIWIGTCWPSGSAIPYRRLWGGSP